MFNNHCSLLLFDNPRNLCNEFFRIILEQTKLVFTNALKYSGDRPSCENRSPCNFTNQIILNLTCFEMLQHRSFRFHILEGLPVLYLILLFRYRCRVLQHRYVQIFINRVNRITNQFITVKINSIRILVIDISP